MFPINSNIFKAYDIRGVYGRDFDDELAYLLGLAFVALRKNDPDYQPNKPLRIAVGRDMRLSSPDLQANLLRGIADAGAEAIDLGLVATPTMYFAVGHYDYDGGIIVSASHNPKEWNGFKLVRANGVPVSGETGINALRDSILKGDLRPAATIGKITANSQALDESIRYSLSCVDIKPIKPLKVAIDTANGMGATYITPLLAGLPIELIPINFELDGSFPAHEADPLKEANLIQLQEAVRSRRADLGIAIDGDGDRIFFVDNTGLVINPAITRGILAKLFLADRPGAKIGYDVRPGKITVDLINEGGGQPVLTRVGHSLIKEQMISEDIYFAGESSGHFYWQGGAGCFEYPGVIILKMMLAISLSGQGAADYIKPYQKYFASGEINREVGDKDSVLENLARRYADGRITRLDGISIEYPDFWFNVRGSNTEPKIRLNLEAVDQKTMEEKRNEVLGLIV
jgi:phosphomannomutase